MNISSNTSLLLHHKKMFQYFSEFLSKNGLLIIKTTNRERQFVRIALLLASSWTHSMKWTFCKWEGLRETEREGRGVRKKLDQNGKKNWRHARKSARTELIVREGQGGEWERVRERERGEGEGERERGVLVVHKMWLPSWGQVSQHLNVL